MKGHRKFSLGLSYYLINAALVLLLVFLLFPVYTPRARAESDNSTEEIVLPGDNATTEIPPVSDNATEATSPVSDNATEATSPASDNTTIEIPPSSDNTTQETSEPDDVVTPEIQPDSDNVTWEEPSISDNVTPEMPSSDNATPETNPQSDNITPETLIPSDNVTLELPFPDMSEGIVSPDEEGQISSSSGKIKLRIPKGAVSKPAKIKLSEHNLQGSTGMKMVNFFELNASDVDTKEKVDKFKKELEITIQHTPEELAGLDIDSLYLYYLDEETGQWLPVLSQFDRDTLTLTANLKHFSYYGEQANPLQNGPGRIMASQVDLNSGAGTFSYPFELPPGPGGFKPSLTLTYNSGAVDGMKNKRDMGSWVGIGWSLHLGRISCDLSANEYFLDLNGGSYKLFTSDGTNFKTQPEQYFKITRSGNTWNVYDREGVNYRFGDTTDSQQYVYDTSKKYYRWDLSLIQDTNGNQATITYAQEIRGTSPSDTVRAAYPSSITYGNIQVIFTLGYDENDATDGYLRYDNPKSYGSNPAPKLMETRRLNAIEIKVNSNLIRKYTFGYTTVNRVYSTDYSGIYYSGTLKLNNITQYGADGTSTLPAMTFTYQDKQVYRKTSETQYTGNPGNPATLTWPFLTTINSGYGGSISFSYTQINPLLFDTWTRQAVTTKTVVSGIGPTETYTYTYTGNRQYLGTGWDQQFRGWNEVRETDAAGNYVKHWFYTTGTIGGKDAEKLTGREYRTQWYDSSNNLLKTKTYEWTLNVIENSTLTIRPNATGEINQLYPQPGSPNWDCVDESGGGDGDTTYVRASVNGNWAHDLYGLPDQNDVGVITSVRIYIRHRGDGNIGTYSRGRTAIKTNGSEYYGSAIDVGANYILSFTEYTVNPKTGVGWTFNEINSLQAGYSGFAQFEYYYYNWGQCTQVWVEVDYQRYEIQLTQVDEIIGANDVIVNSTLIIRPNATGDISQLSPYPGAPNWDCVDESGSGDEDSTYVRASVNGDWAYDLYGLPDQNDAGVITNVRIYIRHRGVFSIGGYSRGRTVTKTNGSEYYGSAIDVGANYILSFTEYTVNPKTGVGWTFDEINSLQAGYSGFAWAEYYYYCYGQCTQVWVEVDYQRYEIQIPAGAKTSRTRFVYDSYGNVITQYLDGDISTPDDDATIHRVFYPNTSANILSKPARERVYTTITGDIGGANLKKESLYYYDGNNTSLTTPPTKGNLTRVEQKKDASNSVSSYFTYDTWGNILTSKDPKDYITNFTYDATNTYLATKTLPVTGLTESYTYVWNWTEGSDTGVMKLTMTDINGITTISYYDKFDRLSKVVKTGDSYASPSIRYDYTSWGTINQQNITTTTKIDGSNTLWQKDYFDGLGRVVQTHNNGESGHTIISSTTTFNNRGLADKQYVSQDIASVLNSYQTPDAGWKYSTFTYDGLGRVVTQTGADGTSISHDFSTAWRDVVADANNHYTRYYYDAFNRLKTVEEMSNSTTVYATTTYTYDVLSNLKTVVDNNGNTTSMFYDWLSRKTDMTDPDMGNWSYFYDNNSNLTTQTDAKSQTITMAYDALNRLLTKNYPAGSGMTNISYVYDSISGGNYGKGQRTSMTDAVGTTTYNYDNRGRLIEEKRTIGGENPEWANRIQITIDHTKIDSALTYFPVLIHLSGNCGQNAANMSQVFDALGSNYKKLAVTTSDGQTQLYIEVERWDAVNKEAWLWVSKSGWQISSTQDTILYLYYDNSHADNDAFVGLTGSAPAKSVWDANFVLVDHLKDGATSSVTTDSTSYANNGAKKGAGEPLETTGKDGKAQNYDNTNDYINYGKTASLNALTSSVTVESVVKPNTLGTTGTARIMDKMMIVLRLQSNNNAVFHIADSNSVSVDATSDTNTITLGAWNYVAGVFNGTNCLIYTNTTQKVGGSTSNPIKSHSTKNLYFGNIYTFDRTFDGVIDEFRISNVARSAAWLKASYYSNWDNLVSFTESPVEGGIYTTSFTYDGANRPVTITYPTGEVVTQNYNGRGLPNSLSGNVAGNIVTSTLYNSLGMVKEINLGNGLRTTYGYYGTGGAYDTTGGYYGRLWEIKTLPQAGGTALQDIRHTWDAGGNLATRQDVLLSETETFTCDFLDRLTGVSGPYTESYSYNTIGNITSKNGISYTYGDNAHKHAVTAVGSTSYVYDANGNMTTRGTQTLAWDVENRPVTVSGGATFVYDGDGNRVKKTEGGQTVLYVNKYYEKNLTTGVVTSNYYHGGQLVAMKEGTTLRYVHQDHLTGTSLMTGNTGSQIGATMKYLPFGGTRSGSVPTDKKFTGQRLDATGLYYYNARYYDPQIGRFISPDTIIPNPADPQSFNRYSYCLNNPLKYTDPSGHDVYTELMMLASQHEKAETEAQKAQIEAQAQEAAVAAGEASVQATAQQQTIMTASVTTLPWYMYIPGIGTIPSYSYIIPYITFGYMIYWGFEQINQFKNSIEFSEYDKAMLIAGGEFAWYWAKNYEPDFGDPNNNEGWKTIQSSGNTIKKNTANALNQFNNKDLTAREWGRALEQLKTDHGYSPSYHWGKITLNGSWFDGKGNLVGNLLDYLP